jgi:hypothetical protein
VLLKISTGKNGPSHSLTLSRKAWVLLVIGRQPFYNRAPSSGIRLDANAIIDG